MFNAGVRGKRAKDTTGILTVGEHFNQQQYLVPTVSRFAITDGSYNETNDTAADTSGNQTIVLYGSGFAPGATVIVGTNTIGVVTFLDSSRLAFSSPALGSGSYTIFVTNVNGGTGILVPGLVYSGLPTFTTSAGSLGSVYETTAINTSVVATGDAPITYSLYSGSLPSGATLSSGGTISGTAPVDGSSTTYSFTIQASDAENQDSVRSFSLTVNTDVVSFSSPANNTTYNITQDIPISNVTTVATSAAGYGVLYTTSGLPTGLSMNTSTGIISGTATVLGSNTSIITATANTTSRSATLYLNWSINLAGDLFWEYTSLLLSANTIPNGVTFNTDSSPINSQISVIADAKSSKFNPFEEGYYSNYFDGTGDYLSFSANSAFAISADYTIEAWIYKTDSGTQRAIVDLRGNQDLNVLIYTLTNNKLAAFNSTSTWITSNATIPLNQWTHVALTRSGTSARLFINGIIDATATNSDVNVSNGTPTIGRQVGSTTNDWLGYISNVRILKGTALYTANTTPPTGPLTYVANTSLLTCQSNRLIDNSNNNFTITKNGDVTVSPFVPFDGAPTTITVPAANNYSMYFDGTGDYLSLTSNTAFNMGTTNFTVEGWYYFTGLPGAGTNDNLYNFGTYNPYLYLWGDGTIILRSSQVSGDIINVTHNFSLNQWYHLALVKTGTSFVLYKNGAVLGSGTSSNIVSENKTLEIGGQSTFGFTGYLSNFRIVKDTSVYTEAFTPPTSPLSVIANTSLLTCQANTVIDNSNNAFAITVNGDARPTRNGPFANTSTVTLIGNEGSAYFDGTGDYLNINNTPAVDLATGAPNWTVECWFYTSSFASSPCLIQKDGSSGTVQPQYSLALTTTGTIQGVLSPATSSTGNQNFISTAVASLNTWNHVAMVRNGNNLSIYLNGALVVGPTAITVTMGNNTRPLTIGANNPGANYLTGYISNVRITKGTALYTSAFVPSWSPLTPVANTVLLTTQTSLSSNTKSFIDESNFNNIITKNGIPSTGSFTPFGTSWSNYFDGTGDYLTVPFNQFLFGSNDFTVECWIYPIAELTLSPIVGIYRESLPSSSNSSWSLRGGVGGTFSIVFRYYGTGAGSTTNLTSSSNAYALNTWTHVAAVRSGNTLSLYINGVLNTSASISVTLAAASGTNLGIAADYAGLSPQNMFISNLRITNGTGLYTSNTTPSITPLTAVANTVLLTCQSNQFIDNSNNALTITRNGDSAISKFSPFSSFTITNPSAVSDYSANTFGSSIYFGGTTTADFLSVSGIPISATGQFTFEAWFYTTKINGATAQIFYSQYTTSDANRWTINISTANKLTVSHGTAGNITGATTIVPYQWNHVAVTRDASNTLRVFLNGVVDVVFTSYTSSIMQSAPRVGYYNNTPNDYFTGYMNSVRVLNGTALYSSNTSFTPPTKTLTSIANTTLLLGSTLGGSPITDVTRINNIENGNTAVAVANNSPYYDTYSGYFDGTGDYLTVASNTAFQLGTGDYTFETWIYPTALGSINTNNILNIGTYLTGLLIRSAATTGIEIYTNGTQRLITTTGLTQNAWNHIALVRNGSTCTFYVNGNRLGSTFTDSSSISPATATVTIGMAAHNNSEFFTGYMSNYRLLKGTALYTANTTPPTSPLTAISGTSLLTCQSNSFVDKSTNAFTITKAGDARISTIQPFAANNTSRFTSAYFPAKGDYLGIRPQPSLVKFSGDFTFECWVYPSDATVTHWGIWDSRQAGGTANPMVFKLSPLASPVSGSYRMEYYNGTSYYGTTTITHNQWTHVAWVRSGSTVTFYVNGNAGGTATVSGVQVGNITSGSIYAGGSKDNQTAGYGIIGYIADLRVTNGYARTISVPTTPYDIK
jgi:hypothetical protein